MWMTIYIYIYMGVFVCVKFIWRPQSRAIPRVLFQLLLHQGVEEDATPLTRLLHFTLDTYLINAGVKQRPIKYHFLNLCYNSTWD